MGEAEGRMGYTERDTLFFAFADGLLMRNSTTFATRYKPFDLN